MTLIQSEPKKIYIRVDVQEWQPGANTLAYFPLTEDQLDKSGNGVTINKTLTKSSIGYVVSQSGTLFQAPSTEFCCCWFKINSISTTSSSFACQIFNAELLGSTVFWPKNSTTSYDNKIQTYSGSGATLVGDMAGFGTTTNIRHYFAISYYNGTIYVCKDGVVTSQYTGTPYNYGNNIYLLNIVNTQANIEYSNIIAESTGWTAQEMSDYYDQTRGNYGL